MRGGSDSPLQAATTCSGFTPDAIGLLLYFFKKGSVVLAAEFSFLQICILKNCFSPYDYKNWHVGHACHHWRWPVVQLCTKSHNSALLWQNWPDLSALNTKVA